MLTFSIYYELLLSVIEKQINKQMHNKIRQNLSSKPVNSNILEARRRF